MTDPHCYPVDFDFEPSLLKIHWADGAQGTIPLAELRRNCPCSGCRAERDDATKNPLHVLSAVPQPASQTSVERAELAGAYALRILWKDGHGTGIYDFGLLRSLFNQLGTAT